MNDGQPGYLSQEKFDSLSAELANIKEEKIPSIAKKIDSAKQMGDLSENAEYHAAREEMAWAQSRVKELNYILDNYEIVSDTQKSNEIISIGSKIEVKINDQKREYIIVGAQEADPIARKISNESPLGQAFIGKSKGDTVDVRVPAGIQTYKIININ
ncbi:MAG: transcription elongation factor GreA [bacterium]|nr:transcription elongation factor GreA [bacterium]